MKECADRITNTICTYYDKQAKKRTNLCPGEKVKEEGMSAREVAKFQKGVQDLRWRLPGFLLITLALLLGGCGVEARYTDEMGREFYYRRTGAQQIGEALLELPDGSTFLMDGQKSAMPPIKVTLPHGIIIESGGKEVNP